MAESMTSVKRLQALERQRQALELRKEGKGFVEIAAKLGYKGPSGAHQAVMRALRRTLQEPCDELRRLELERCDALLAGLWPKAKKGHVASVDKVLKVMERRAKLLGLDAPTKIDIEAEVREFARAMGRDEAEAVKQAIEIINGRAS